MRVKEWLAAVGLSAVLTVPTLAQAQTGTLRVSVKVPATLTPVPGVQISLTPLQVVSGETLLDLPDNEEDLLAYLQELAAQRGILGGELQVSTGHSGQTTSLSLICPRSSTSPAKIASPSAVTDADGNATIPNLKSGRYELRAGREGYLAVLPPQASSAVAARSVSAEVTLDSARVSETSLFLNPAATVNGRIVDRNGVPVVDACVQLVQVGHGTGLTPGPRARTDNDGTYRLQDVSPGVYAIRAQAAQPSAVIGYFPGVIGLEKATSLSIQAGSDTVNIDFKLP
jgi:Carboxypeptidase regulatory-like domain